MPCEWFAQMTSKQGGKKTTDFGLVCLNIPAFFFLGGVDVYSPKPLKYPIFFLRADVLLIPKTVVFFLLRHLFVLNKLPKVPNSVYEGDFFVFKKGSLAYTPPKTNMEINQKVHAGNKGKHPFHKTPQSHFGRNQLWVCPLSYFMYKFH